MKADKEKQKKPGLVKRIWRGIVGFSDFITTLPELFLGQ